MRFEDHHWDLPTGLALVVVVVGPDLGHIRPHRSALLRRRGPRPGREALALHLDLDVGILLEVLEPRRVLLVAAVGRHDQVPAVVLAEDQWREVRLARDPALRRQDEDRRAASPEEAFLAVGLEVAAHVLSSVQHAPFLPSAFTEVTGLCPRYSPVARRSNARPYASSTSGSVIFVRRPATSTTTSKPPSAHDMLTKVPPSRSRSCVSLGNHKATSWSTLSSAHSTVPLNPSTRPVGNSCTSTVMSARTKTWSSMSRSGMTNRSPGAGFQRTPAARRLLASSIEITGPLSVRGRRCVDAVGSLTAKRAERPSHRPSWLPSVSVSDACTTAGEICPQCEQADLRPYGNGSKWVCPHCSFVLPCCEGSEITITQRETR